MTAGFKVKVSVTNKSLDSFPLNAAWMQRICTLYLSLV